MNPTIKLKKQIDDAQLPTQLELYTELNKRDALSIDNKEELVRLKSGLEGEQTILNYIKKYGEPHWKVFQNVWLDYYGKFEVDCMLVTRKQIYLFEVKNYTGHYVFRNSQCSCNGQKIGHNAINQAQKSYISFQNFLRQNQFNVPITGALIFTGIDCEVTVNDEVDDLKIVTRNQLRNFIWQIRNNERNYTRERVDTDHLIQILENYEINNPFLPEPISDETESLLQKGIKCSQCNSFEVDTSKSYISCRCGMHEPRENAIVRTICEYGVIHFDKDLVTTNIVNFFNGDYSRLTITKYLARHFVRIGKGRGSKYKNPAKLIWKIISELNLQKR